MSSSIKNIQIKMAKEIVKICIRDGEKEECSVPKDGHFFLGTGEAFKGDKFIGKIDIGDPDIRNLTFQEIINILEEKEVK